MLTIMQPVHYGYKSVHDLPTPPGTSRPSPPLVFQESTSQKPLPSIPRSISPPNQSMSAPNRGLPPPAAMTLAQPPPPGAVSHPPPPPGASMSQAQPPPPQTPQSQHLAQLPAQWQGSEESTKAWLAAKAEEEKRRAEEERTRQETLRLEQRRMEHDILRTSLQGGVPPPMVPVIFAGMGGGNLPQAALDWAHQFMYSPGQQVHPQQLLPAAVPLSPEHRRESQAQAYSHYPGSGGIPTTPGSAQASHGGYASGYPGSPTRPRGYSNPSLAGRQLVAGSQLPSLNTNMPHGPGAASAHPSHHGIASAQQESQASPSIYFHHWQPPSSQTGHGSSQQPATPSVGESPRNKRKATGPQPGVPPPRERFRSPPFSQSTGSTLSNPPPGRRRGHSRQRSDLSSYRPSGRGRPESFIGAQRSDSPAATSASGMAREGSAAAEAGLQHQQQGALQSQSQSQARSGAHTVSSLLSEDPSPPHMSHYPSVTSSSDVRENERRNSPQSSDERQRGGAGGSAATRERDND